MKKVQIVTDAPRRRRFTDEFKAEVLGEIASGCTLAETARKHDLAQSLLHHWRKQAAKDSPFVKIVASSTEEVHPTPVLLSLPMRITSPHGVVLEVGSPIALEHVIYLVRKIGERT